MHVKIAIIKLYFIGNGIKLPGSLTFLLKADIGMIYETNSKLSFESI